MILIIKISYSSHGLLWKIYLMRLTRINEGSIRNIYIKWIDDFISSLYLICPQLLVFYLEAVSGDSFQNKMRFDERPPLCCLYRNLVPFWVYIELQPEATTKHTHHSLFLIFSLSSSNRAYLRVFLQYVFDVSNMRMSIYNICTQVNQTDRD